MTYNILLLGRSGSGKGTQAKQLQEHFNIGLYISTGDLMREIAKNDTLAGKKLSKIMEEGGLAPDWLPEALWIKELVDKAVSPDAGLIFDGMARRVEEAHTLNRVMKWFGLELTPILIDVTREEAFNRLKARGRADDDDDTINERLEWFDDEVMQTVNYYKDKGQLIVVDGMPNVDRVFENILDALKK